MDSNPMPVGMTQHMYSLMDNLVIYFKASKIFLFTISVYCIIQSKCLIQYLTHLIRCHISKTKLKLVPLKLTTSLQCSPFQQVLLVFTKLFKLTHIPSFTLYVIQNRASLILHLPFLLSSQSIILIILCY